MKIKFTKMHGCGNDFVIVDYDEYLKSGIEMPEFAKRVCDRHFGIGADGLIIPNTKPNTETDIGWFFYNSDGSSAQMCGNGMRCFAKYLYDNKIVDKKSFSVDTLAGVIKPEVLPDGRIKVDMGIPILEDEKIPFKGERKIQIQDKLFDITPVSMGNPHCVIFTDEIPFEMAEKYGPELEKHSYFPQKTNVEFVRVKSETEIDLCVYERGCGITLACGTGACASVVSCVLNNLTENNVKVNLPGGVVNVMWQGSCADRAKNIFLTGPAEYIFTGEYIL